MVPHLAWATPFAVLLLAIAVLPMIPHARHWWEAHASKLAIGLLLGQLVLIYYGVRGYGFEGHAPGAPTVFAVLERAVLHEYVPFIVLLFSLYVVTGGVLLGGDVIAKPWVNAALLGGGALAANLIGTTGASMLLIRPLLRINRDRRHKQHTVVFFIFLVSNIGGALTPIGDPPLFLGYLRGVPFLWTLRLIKPWLFSVATLLAVYYIWDRIAFARESRADIEREQRHASRIRLHGAINLVWLVGLVLSVALIVPGRPLPGTNLVVGRFVREGILLAFSLLSLATTPRGLRRQAEFGYGSILEVAALFLGIFLTMQVPIEILKARGAELGLKGPAFFFWATGGLSGFLDNAPTYLVFLEAAKSLTGPEHADTVGLIDGAVRADLLAAVSLGSVFMGANTYIGNGPNFMVKSIAEARALKMPSFFGYMLYSGAVLLPLFIVVTLLFFT